MISEIQVFSGDLPVGNLHVYRRNNREIIEFAYADSWLTSGFALSPELPLVSGRVAPRYGMSLFGVFEDAAPDSWGRKILHRAAIQSGISPAELTPLKYLLMVPDEIRQGALRFFDADNGWLATSGADAGFSDLQIIDEALETFLQSGVLTDDGYRFFGASSAQGGAQKKAVLRDEAGKLWVAKFPVSDVYYDHGRWELATAMCMRECGIATPEAKCFAINADSAVFLSQRFDRADGDARFPYMSMRTLMQFFTGNEYGGVNPAYTLLANQLRTWSAGPSADLLELFKRCAFNVIIGNNDDHMRNIGLIRGDSGWRLAQAFDVNPAPANVYSDTPVMEDTNPATRSVAQLLESARYFDLTDGQAETEVSQILEVTKQMPDFAKEAGVDGDEIKDGWLTKTLKQRWEDALYALGG